MCDEKTKGSQSPRLHVPRRDEVMLIRERVYVKTTAHTQNLRKTKWASASHCSLRLTSTSNNNNNNINSHCICRGRPNASSSGTLQFPMAILLTCAATHINVRLEYFGAETCERRKCGDGWRLTQRRGKREGNVHNTHNTHSHITYSNLTGNIEIYCGKYFTLVVVVLFGRVSANCFGMLASVQCSPKHHRYISFGSK